MDPEGPRVGRSTPMDGDEPGGLVNAEMAIETATLPAEHMVEPAAASDRAQGALDSAAGAVPPAASVEAPLAAIQFKADGEDLASAVAAPGPPMIHLPVGDLPVGLALPAAAISIGFGFVLLGALLPYSQTGGGRPLLAIESVAAGAAPTAGYWFALGAVLAGFASQLIAYPVLARRGRRFAWVLLLLAVGAGETAGFAIARRAGSSISGDLLTALPPVLGMIGGVLTGVAGLALGFMGTERDGLKCRECRAILTRESGFCPDCGAWLTEVTPTRSRVASAWHSGTLRGASSVVVLALAVAGVVLLVLSTAPQP
jgi:hypothetical protein